MWGIFGKHHYLSADFNKAAEMFLIYWGDTLVAMNSVLPMPCGTSKYSYRSHRLVVLPDFQGLGIGTKINEFFGKYYVDKGLKYFMRTTHVRLKRNMEGDALWKATASNGKLRKNVNDNNHSTIKYDDKRIAASFEYVGEDYATKPHKVLVVDDDDTVTKEELLELKDKYYLVVATGKASAENDVERLCKELGIRTELLYINKNGVLSKNRKFFCLE